MLVWFGVKFYPRKDEYVIKLLLKAAVCVVKESKYKIVDLNHANIDEYGTFCLQSKKNTKGYRDKLKWVKERFKEGCI